MWLDEFYTMRSRHIRKPCQASKNHFQDSVRLDENPVGPRRTDFQDSVPQEENPVGPRRIDFQHCGASKFIKVPMVKIEGRLKSSMHTLQ